MNGRRIRSSLTVRHNDPLVREHRVQEIHILPGVALLDVIYRTLAAAGQDLDAVVLRQILFHEPVVTRADCDRHLTLTAELSATQGRIRITSQPSAQATSPSVDTTLHLTCTLALDNTLAMPALATVEHESGAPAEDLDACYGVTRRIGIFHDDFMKCSGSVTVLPDGGFLATIRLGDRAYARTEDFILHPVLLDCSTIVHLFHVRDRLAEASLFIPFMIKEFQARPMNGLRRAIVKVDRPDEAIAGRELLDASFSIYDTDGLPLARFRSFIVKRVRSLDDVRRRLTDGGGHRLRVPDAAHSAPEPQSTAGSADWLTVLVGSLVAGERGQPLEAGEFATSFFDLGLDSVALLEMADRLEAALGVRLYPTALFEHGTPEKLAAHLRQANPDLKQPSTGEPAACAAALQPAVASGDPVLAWISRAVERFTGRAWTHKGVDTSFFDLGLDSVELLEVSDQLADKLGIRLYPTVLFEHPTPNQFARYLTEAFPEQVQAIASGVRAPEPPAATAAAAPADWILVPRWVRSKPEADYQPDEKTAIALLTGNAMPIGDPANGLVYRSGPGDDAVERFGEALESGLNVDEILISGLDHIAVFALIKLLLSAGRLDSPLAITALTFNAVSVHGEPVSPSAEHGVWGLLQSLSREHPMVRVGNVDLAGSVPSPDSFCFPPRTRAQRAFVAIRDGHAYERRLFRAAPPKASFEWLRTDGVYLVIGGAGGIGMEVLAHLRQRHQARVAIIGRRPLTAEVRQRIAEFGAYERDILYVQAPVDDETRLAGAIEQIRAQFGALHGIIHAAMVLDDRRLEAMDSESFERVLQPKVAGIQALARATAEMNLDFLLFFSSIQSFIGNVSQANYAAASTFLDGFASALRAQRSYPVAVINWGFWSEVGAVASEPYRRLLARQGMHGLQAPQALAMLDEVMAAGWEQALILRAEEPVVREMGLLPDWTVDRSAGSKDRAVTLKPAASPAARDIGPRLTEMQQPMEALLRLARRRAAQSLAETGRVTAEHAAWAEAVRQRLEQDGAFSANGPDAAAFQQEARQIATTYPVIGDFVPLLSASLEALPDILAGRVSAADVLFPGGSTGLVRPVYGGNEISLFYNRIVADAVTGMASGEPARPLRIIEIGAGTGATTREVLSALDSAGLRCDYCYTDLWDKLITDAKARLAPDWPNLSFRFLDISNDPARQGFTETYDIVIATNVLHAARDLRAALRHAKRLLRPGGAIVLNESVESQEYSIYTFGLLPGWWNALDRADRLPDSPLASMETWSLLLKEEGFTGERRLVTAPGLGAQQVFVAWSDGELLVPAGTTGASRSARPATGEFRPLRPGEFGFDPSFRPSLIELQADRRNNLWIFLNNPPANTFTSALLDELCRTFDLLADQPPQARSGRIVYLSHRGDYFSLGGDRGELMRMVAAADHAAIEAFADKSRRLLERLATLDAVVVAVVNGTAQGGGLETLLATDLQFVRDGVKLGLPEVRSGLIPGMGGMTYLAGQIGTANAKRLVLLGELIDAAEARRLGIVTHAVADPVAAALAVADQLTHLETALHAKKLLGRRTAESLTADLDDWFRYVTSHRDLIDARRIADSAAMLAAQSSRSINMSEVFHE